MDSVYERELSSYEEKKQKFLQDTYGFSDIVSTRIVVFSSDINHQLVVHWFVKTVASYISKQEDVTDETIDVHLSEFYDKFVSTFGEVPPKPIEKSFYEIQREKAYAQLDRASRHLKKAHKEWDQTFSPVEYGEICYYWGILYNSCYFLKIPVHEYCKATYIPYKNSNERYINFFTPVDLNDPHYAPNTPMLAIDYFYPIIAKLENTAN